jgi:hypothetical protein
MTIKAFDSMQITRISLYERSYESMSGESERGVKGTLDPDIKEIRAALASLS